MSDPRKGGKETDRPGRPEQRPRQGGGNPPARPPAEGTHPPGAGQHPVRPSSPRAAPAPAAPATPPVAAASATAPPPPARPAGPPAEPPAAAAAMPPPPAPPPPPPQRAKRPAPRPSAARPANPASRPAPPPAPVVPPQSVAGNALILVVAIMGFLACLAFGVLTLVNDAARAWQLDVSREITIQVKPLDGVPQEANLEKTLAIARETDGVRSVRLMSEAESGRLLEPWLGAGLDLSGLPVPRLVVIDLEDPAATDLAGLRARLEREVRGAVLDDHSVWAARLRTMAGTMVVAGMVVLLLVMVAMVLSVVFATRAAMAGNRDVIEVLHFVGAEDSFIAREFQRHFLLMGLKGGAVGGVAAMASFAIADWVTRGAPGNAAADQAQALFGGFSVGWVGYLGAGGIVGLVAVLTALTSRLTVRSYLNQLE